MIRYLVSTWTPTALGATFDYYEISRSEDGGATWSTMAQITTEGVAAYRDHESLRGVTTRYRIRVARKDGALSAWSAVDTAETPQAGWVFTTNEAPQLGLEVDVWRDTEKRHDWGFEANEAEYEVAGRDGAVVLKGLENPLDLFMLAVVIIDETHPGREVFDALLALSRTPLAYVCVHSPEGRRWLANLTVEEGSQEQIRQVYTAPTRVRELTNVPAIIDVAPAP